MDNTPLLLLLMTLPAVISAAMTPVYIKANKAYRARRAAAGTGADSGS